MQPNRRYKQQPSTSAQGEIIVQDLTVDQNTVREGSLQLPTSIRDRLFEHQLYGVNWMYNLHINSMGGILGDDMGLGKTFQVVSLLTGLAMSNQIQKVLIAAPVSVLSNWQRELELHLMPHIPRTIVHILNSEMTKRRRLGILDEVFCSESGKHFIISSHQMITNMIDDFLRGKWDYVILDEGHVIKNPATKMYKAMKSLKTNHRLLLTGTPIQNKLEEFWAVVDWATNGKAFGSIESFSKMIADPISKGQNPTATELQLLAAKSARQILTDITKPILLQRKKKEQPKESLKLPQKMELVIWINLSTQQRTMYERYFESRACSKAFNTSRYPVEVITYLKTLCRHPVLLEVSEGKQKIDDVDDLAQTLAALRVNDSSAEMNHEDYGIGHLFDAIARVPPAEELLRGSVKLRVLVKMVTALIENGHRVLVFSQSKLMLQIIQHILIAFDFASYKIDGSTNAKDRQAMIDDFNNTSDDYSGPLVCLLTTKACGCGITLTGADRVIIFDPSWNPAEDRQAVDRAYRIGQRRSVIVYRLIQASCVEEKIYEKQVFKEGLRVVSEKGIATEKYFAGQAQFKELLALGPPKEVTILQKITNHMELLETDDLMSITGILGCTRHDELYSADDEVHATETKSDSKIETQSITRDDVNLCTTGQIELRSISTAHSNVIDLTKDIAEKAPDVNSPQRYFCSQRTRMEFNSLIGELVIDLTQEDDRGEIEPARKENLETHGIGAMESQDSAEDKYAMNMQLGVQTSNIEVNHLCDNSIFNDKSPGGSVNSLGEIEELKTNLNLSNDDCSTLTLIEVNELAHDDHFPESNPFSELVLSPFKVFSRPQLFSPSDGHVSTCHHQQSVQGPPINEHVIVPQSMPTTPSAHHHVKIIAASAFKNGCAIDEHRISFLNLDLSPQSLVPGENVARNEI